MNKFCTASSSICLQRAEARLSAINYLVTHRFFRVFQHCDLTIDWPILDQNAHKYYSLLFKFAQLYIKIFLWGWWIRSVDKQFCKLLFCVQKTFLVSKDIIIHYSLFPQLTEMWTKSAWHPLHFLQLRER